MATKTIEMDIVEVEAPTDIKSKPSKTKGPMCPVCPSEGDDAVVAEAFMRCAAASATAGVKLQHGGPFGACVVRGGIVMSCAHNSVLLDKDPTCHAEMNAIRQACTALASHDLSDCELYTSCEPCPMCWGAVQWSRLNKVYIGADRFTAAKYGFDDKVFYDEVEKHAQTFGLHRYGFIADSNNLDEKDLDSKEKRQHKNMMEVTVGILKDEVEALFASREVNKTYRRKLQSGSALREIYENAFKDRPFSGSGMSPQDSQGGASPPSITSWPSFADEPEGEQAIHEAHMREVIEVAKRAARQGSSKEREPFAAVVVKDGKIIVRATNSVLQTRDATATAEVNALRAAARELNTYDLQECTLYTTTVPDVMSMAACLWARVPKVYCGVSQEFALRFGHEEGWLQFQELMAESPSDRIIPTVDNVARSDCEDVFKFWSTVNGKIY